jgi:pseudaminic acid biosynthesis-associated methylase
MDTKEFWRGDFGAEYHQRIGSQLEGNTMFFDRLLDLVGHDGVTSILELGCGNGQNLAAIYSLEPKIDLYGVEINAEAAQAARAYGTIQTASVTDTDPILVDMVMTKGLLIHIPPEDLPKTYDVMAESAVKYIVINEYFNPVPVEVEYRGHTGKLWKRDFAAEFLARHPEFRFNLALFWWKHGPEQQDNLTSFILERV